MNTSFYIHFATLKSGNKYFRFVKFTYIGKINFRAFNTFFKKNRNSNIQEQHN